MHIHLIGIGGTGLSAIAKVLLEQGHTVSGSDRQYSPLAQAVEAAGAKVFVGHRAEQVAGADMVVRSSAVPEDNVEVIAAQDAGIPVFKRSEFIGHLTDPYKLIAIAGTHGKTTTTAMMAYVLSEMGLDPSFICGGIVENLGTNAKAGASEFFIIEADEYDYMFLGLKPDIAVITNVEHDHPDMFPTRQDFVAAFGKFLGKIRSDGIVLACGDNAGVQDLLQSYKPKAVHVFTYGIKSMDTDYKAIITAEDDGSHGYGFDFYNRGKRIASCRLSVAGIHNVYNSCAVLAVIDQLGLSVQDAANLLANFVGSGRRFDIRGEVDGVIIIDDYAHHPTEIEATLQAARSRYPDHTIWAVWQPHTFSRVKVLWDEFVTCFDKADHVVITEVYPARESRPEGFSEATLANEIQHDDVHFIPEFPQVVSFLLGRLGRRDVLLVLSAGDAIQISEYVLNALRNETWSRSIV